MLTHARAYRGILFLLLAELLFTVSTVFSKLLTGTSGISAIEVTFARFFLGLIVIGVMVFKNSVSLVPNRPSLLIWRGVLNTIAVILFFLASHHTTITNTHMLNMTYPFFIFLFAPLFFRGEKISPILYPLLVLALTGVWLVVNPDLGAVKRGEIYGLMSAVFAALSIITLNLARRKDSTMVILFYLMLIGTVLNGIVMLPVFVLPQGGQWALLMASAAVGVAGQVCITYGYRYITARSGSLVSTSRILYAVVLGMIIFGDVMTWRVLAGGLLITISIIAVTLLSRPDNAS
ncbi:MAG: DMT family transporter [Smithellaceae bacterium]